MLQRTWNRGSTSTIFKSVNECICLERRCSFTFGETLGAYTYRDMLSVPRTEGLEQVICKPLDGQSAKVYHPESIAGINAATAYSDRAKQFVSMMLSTNVQDNTPFGFPVNKKSLVSSFAYNENKLDENGGQYSTSYSIDGVKYGFTVYSLEENENLTEKTLADVKSMIQSGQIKYIFAKEQEENSKTVEALVKEGNVEVLRFHMLSNITEDEKNNGEDYISIMNKNLELLKQELYD